MERFSLSYSELIEEVENYPQKYGQLLALGKVREKVLQAQHGNAAIDENLSENLEGAATRGRMNESVGRIDFAKQKLAEASSR